MATKSIIDVDVNDEAFSTFHALFNEYKDELAKTPAQWKDVDKVVGELHSSFEAMTAALVTHADMTGKIATSGKKQTLEIQTQARHWGLISRATKESGLHLKDMTTNLLKWSSITSLIPAAIGAGGLFGVERLAQTATDRRREAMGIGATTGGQRAFDTAYGRVFGEGFVGRVGEELETPGSVGLSMLGVKGKDLQGSTEDVAVRAIIAAQKIAKADPLQMLAVDPRLRMFDLEERRRLKETPQAEFESLKEKLISGKKAGALEDKDLAKWTELSTAIGKAKDTIEATFIRGLAPAAPKIGEFVTALVKGTGTVGGTLDEWAKDLKEFWTKLLKGPAALNKPEPPEKFGSPWNHAIPQSFHGDLNNAEAKLIPAVWAPGGGTGGLGRGGGVGGFGGGSAPGGGGGDVSRSGGAPMRDARDASISGNGGGSVDESGSRSWRNNNPGNIKYGVFAKAHGATGQDSSGYAMFPDETSGTAAQRGLWGSGAYANLPLDEALSKWSSGGYSAEDLGFQGSQKFSGLGKEDQSRLLGAQRKREGWTPRSSGGATTGGAVGAAQTMAGKGLTSRDLEIYLATGHHPNKQKEAWCAEFVGASLEHGGQHGLNTAMATDYLRWGSHVDPKDAKAGDVIVMGRHGTAPVLGRHGHIGLVTGTPSGGRIQTIEGNSGNRVRNTSESLMRGFEIRRGQTPAMAEGKSHPSQTGIARNPATTHHTPYHGFRIEVQNNTGGNAVVSSSALAAGHA